MVIHHYVFHVVVGEKVIPHRGLGVEAIMENKEHIRVDLSHGVADLSVVVLKHVVVRIPPWFVDRLQGVHSGVMSPHVHKGYAVVDSPFDIVVVDVVVGRAVPVAHPITGLYGPVFEVGLVNPFKVKGLARVVKTVLGVFDCVNVKKDFKAIFVGGV